MIQKTKSLQEILRNTCTRQIEEEVNSTRVNYDVSVKGKAHKKHEEYMIEYANEEYMNWNIIWLKVLRHEMVVP